MSEADSDLILQYWSGELDKADTARVKTLLETDEEARAFLTDLEFQNELTRASRPSLQGSPAAAAADIVAAEMAVVKFPRRKWLAVGGSIAAAVLVALMVLNLNQPSPQVTDTPVGSSGKMSEISREINELETLITDAENRSRFRSPRA